MEADYTVFPEDKPVNKEVEEDTLWGRAKQREVDKRTTYTRATDQHDGLLVRFYDGQLDCHYTKEYRTLHELAGLLLDVRQWILLGMAPSAAVECGG